VAAAAMIFVFGGAAGWGGFAYLGGGSGSGEPETTYVRRALDAHVVYAHDTMRPVETGFGQESEMVGWLSDRVGYRLRRPDLQGAGFRLIGGRLVNDRGMPAALFMYEDDRRRRVTLYVCSQPETGKTAFRFIAEHGMVAFYWTDGPLAYALTGEMPRGEVLKLAQMVYADIEGESH
jgi:anti-sigma factor RsiW